MREGKNQMQLTLQRSERRQKTAIRRDRRAAGLHPEPVGSRIGSGFRGLARSRVLQLGLLWSAALTLGGLGGLHLAKEGWPGSERVLTASAPTLALTADPLPPEPEFAADQPAGEAAAPAPDAPLANTLGTETAELAAVGSEQEAAHDAGSEAVTATVAAAVPLDLIGPQSRPAWLANAIPSTVDPERPMIAVVIDDLGLKRRATRQTVALPGPLSLAFLAYAGDLTEQARLARAAGHELLLHQPMEPQGAQDPGPGALLTDLSAEENVARLTKALDRLPTVVGINNHMGSRFTASATALEPVLATLRQRGLLFLDSRTTAESVGTLLANRMGVPSIGRDVFLDHKVGAGRPYVEQQLAELEAIARERGAAVAIGHPHSGTLEALAAWLPQLEARGFQLVPISAVVRAQQNRLLAESNRR